MTRKLFLLILAVATLAHSQNNCPHPAFCKAVDNGEIDKAAKMYKSLGLTGIYCPSNLSLKDVEKIYYNKGDAFFLYCDENFQREYGNSICSDLKNAKKCASFLKYYAPSRWTEEMNNFYTSYGNNICKSSVKDFNDCLSLFSLNKKMWKDEWTDNWLKWLEKNVCSSKDSSQCVNHLDTYYPLKKGGMSKIYDIVVKNYLKNKVFFKSKKLKNKKVVKYIDFVEKDRLIDIAYYIIIKAQSFFAWDVNMAEILALYNAVFGKECVLVLGDFGKEEKICNPLQNGFQFAELVESANGSFCSKQRYSNNSNIYWEDFKNLYEFNIKKCKNVHSCYIGCNGYRDFPDPKVLNVDELLRNVLDEYKQSANINDKAILRLCRLSSGIDKKIEKQMGFEVFSCKKTFEKYNKACTKETLSETIITNLNEEHNVALTPDFIVCDTAGWRLANDVERYAGFCTDSNKAQILQLKNRSSLSNINLKQDVEVMCDPYSKMWREKNGVETAFGFCDSIKQGEIHVSYLCDNYKWVPQNALEMTDLRDGKKYRVIKIGEQTWMAQNLDYKYIIRDDGRSCSSASSDECPMCYDRQQNDDCGVYGRLYSSNEAKSACPAGWHLPDTSEWNQLFRTVGGTLKEDPYNHKLYYDNAGEKLRSREACVHIDTYAYWVEKVNCNGKDEYEFSALTDQFLTSTHSHYVYIGYETYVENFGNERDVGFIRCIKDSAE